MKLKIQKGFTLIEISIVLLIVSILLGYTVAMFSVQQELGQYRKVEKEMNQIVDAIIGFAQINGRVPCPDSGVFDGAEDRVDGFNNTTGVIGADGIDDSCSSYVGRIPTSTLGVSSKMDGAKNLIDPWGNPYIYHVSSTVMPTGGNVVDIVTTNGVKNVGLNQVSAPNLYICDDNSTDPADVDATCADVTGTTVVDNVSIVIVSMGKDGAFTDEISDIQIENSDGDNVYISTEFNDTETGKFDDKVKWISPNVLYSKMIEAGQLP